MVEPGRAHPVGARIVDGGVNFSVFSENAESVELLLFERPTDPHPARVVPLNRGFHFWHAFVPGVGAGTAYAFRAAGPSGGPFRFDGEKALLDPYARSVVTSVWSRQEGGRARRQRRRLSPGSGGRHHRLRLGGRQAACAAAGGDDRLRAARRRLHRIADGGRCRARDVRRRSREDPVPGRPRHHRGRADAGVPVRPDGR